MNVAPIVHQLLAAALLVPFVAGSLLMLFVVVRIAANALRLRS